MIDKQHYFNPFPGLRSFEEAEEYLFFGRERQIDELVNKLSKTRFLAVIGASGSGKSSLVKSGLLPALHSGYLAIAGSGWNICTFRPGNNPIGNLASALYSEEILTEESINSFSVEFIESILRRNDQGIGESIRQLSDLRKKNILIVVDQFEELFRFSKFEKKSGKGESDAVAFINLLIAASKYKNERIYVVFTMRSDFLGDCSEFRGLPESINEGQYLIPRLTREERKAAIVGPIAVGGAQISNALLARLLNDVGDSPDQLPILQHALMRTWDYWSKCQLSNEAIDIKHYEAIGTMSKALSIHAEEAFLELENEKHQEICKNIFKSLTEKRDDGRGVRRPCSISEICLVSNAQLEDVKKIINVFRLSGRSFLMPPIDFELNENTIIDISHESLMRVWDRLINWVNDEVESAELYLRLANASELYAKGKTGLWRDPELLLAINWKNKQNPNEFWAKRYHSSFNNAIKFLNDSKIKKDLELESEENKRKAAISRLRIFILIITIAFCLSLYFGFLSYKNETIAKIAEKRARQSEKKALVKQREADLSNRLALRDRDFASNEKRKAERSSEYSIKQKKIAELALIQSKIATEKAKDSAISANNQRKIALNNAKIAKNETEKAIIAKKEIDRLRLLAETKNISNLANQFINYNNKDTLSLQLAFLAYALNRKLNGSELNNVIYKSLNYQLTNYYSDKLRARKDLKFEVGSYDERDIVFIDNTKFVTCSDQGILKYFEISGTPKEIKEISKTKKNSDNLTNISISNDKKIIVAGSINGNLIFWDLKSLVPISIKASEGYGKCVKLNFIENNTNNYFIIALFKKMAKLLLIDKTSLKLVENKTIDLKSDLDFVSSTVYNKNNISHCIAATSGKLYDFSFDENSMLTGVDTIKLKSNFINEKHWDNSEKISAITSSNNGKIIAIGGNLGTVKLYNTNLFNEVLELRNNYSEVSSICFGPKDSILIFSSFGGKIYVSNVYNNKKECLILEEKKAWIRSIAISPDRSFIVSAGQNGLIQFWPTKSQYLLKEINQIPKYNSILNRVPNENDFREALGNDLFESIIKTNQEKSSFNELWNNFISLYLK